MTSEAVPGPIVVQGPRKGTAPRRDAASLPDRLCPPMPASGGWIGAIIVTAIGAILRLWDLGRPHAIAFDETYYPKDAISLLRFGVERVIGDKANEILLASDGNWRTLGFFTSEPAFVAHPPLGKWTIAVGEYAFGATPFGWRISVAVLGVIAVFLTARITRRLTRSNLIGTLAGLLLALDGIHLVLSRTGLLDMVLGFWVLVGFGCILMDRDRTRARLAAVVRADGLEATSTAWGPRLGIRPWRWAAAFALALACSVKWSGIWFVVAFILLSLVWDAGARKAVGVGRPWLSTLVRGVPSTAVIVLVIVLGTYLASWAGWFLSDDGWGRQWAAGQDPSIVPAALRSLWYYHAQMWNFHVNLSSPHSYQSNPLSWPFMTRPTSFYWDSIKDGSRGCPTDNCSAEVLALGNPIIWWAALLAIPHQAWRWLGHRDWRSAAVLVGIAAGWLPWLLYLNRTIFTFYTVVYVPFVVMALAMTLGAVLGPSDAPIRRRQWGALAVGTIVLLVVVAAWWFYPVWTGQVIPYQEWTLRMWMPTWI
ncbi:MAG: phospholipid carrier-dependent glycosyltransferase [Actinomycetales bacterium]|nr:phospholipid carrier-dependent glycosyltransferase [Actinomycetales bacterium]